MPKRRDTLPEELLMIAWKIGVPVILTQPQEHMRQYQLRVLEMQKPKIRNGIKLLHPRHVRQALFGRKR
jgi:hypothetical protein